MLISTTNHQPAVKTGTTHTKYCDRYHVFQLNAHPLIEASLHASSELEGRDGDNHHIPLCRGKMLLTRGLLDEAAVALDTALSVSNRSVSGWTLLGQVRLLQGRKEEAKIIFSKVRNTILCEQYMQLCDSHGLHAFDI